MSRLDVSASLLLALSFGLVLPLRAEEISATRAGSTPPPATLIAQVQPTKINSVRLQTTDTGISVILETASGQLTSSTTSTQDKISTVDLPDTVLALTTGAEFRAENPAKGIAKVSVVQISPTVVRVSITGIEGVPDLQAVSTDKGLTVTSTPVATTAESDAELEINVVGLRNRRGYRLPNATTSTKTDTPVRDVPQAINIVPPELLRDRGATTFFEALKTVPSVSQGTVSSRGFFDNPVIRGFPVRNTLRDGILDDSSRILGYDAAIIDRIEVLKGPASVLYGQGGLGGTINYITKPPLSVPFKEAQVTVGTYNSYRGAVDLSGPINNDKTLLYRVNLAAQSEGSFVDFLTTNRYVVAPKITWLISDKTKLDFSAEYIDEKRSLFDQGIPAIGSVLPNPNGQVPRNRFLGELGDKSNVSVLRTGYDFEHRFNDNWKVKNGFRVGLIRTDRDEIFTSGLQANNRTVNRGRAQQDFRDDEYSSDTYTVGKFDTGSVKHELTAGIALTRISTFVTGPLGTALPIDLYNPVYNQPRSTPINPNPSTFRGDSVGFYVQDQIALSDNLKFLLGGRFDMANQSRTALVSATGVSTTTSQSQQVFSPRVGVVYQPTPAVSLYSSYGQSFLPSQNAFGTILPQPERGTQYEVGVKVDLNKKLAATLAFYDLSRTNVLTTDPANPQLVIQTGRQKSQGIELDLSGEISPGWNVFAGYAYTDSRIAEDRTFPVGNLLVNVPKHSFNLWTNYEIQTGDLKGLGFGLGLFYADARKGDLLNTFELPGYVRTDAAISYKKDDLRFALNFQNLFNVDYFESALNRNRVYRGDPFTVKATVGLQF